MAVAYKFIPPSPHGEKVVSKSNCSRCKYSTATILKIVLIEVILTTRESISSKSIPFFYVNPFTTSLAL